MPGSRQDRIRYQIEHLPMGEHIVLGLYPKELRRFKREYSPTFKFDIIDTITKENCDYHIVKISL